MRPWNTQRTGGRCCLAGGVEEETGHCACSKGKRCLSPGKHPIGKLAPNGAENASLDPEQVRSWWAQYPLANIGGLVGPRANKAVLDVGNLLMDTASTVSFACASWRRDIEKC